MRRIQTVHIAGALVLVLVVMFANREGSRDLDGPDWMVADRSSLMRLPTSGPAWEAMLAVADARPGEVRLDDPQSLSAGRTLAAALVHARTGQTRYRDLVVAELERVPSSPLRQAKVLSVARQLPGWIIAADLVGHRDPDFVRFVDDIRTRHIGNHPRFIDIKQVSERTATNWGAWALAARVAADLYLDDRADLARAADIFKGFTGDRNAYAGFTRSPDFDPSWACDASRWVPVNPTGCGGRSGAIVEDISRSSGSYPTMTSKGEMYSWGTLSAAMLTARLLFHGGYPDVYEWGDRALLRAGQFLHQRGSTPPPHRINQHVPWMLHHAYGAYPSGPQPAGFGRSFGYTDWLTSGEVP